MYNIKTLTVPGDDTLNVKQSNMNATVNYRTPQWSE